MTAPGDVDDEVLRRLRSICGGLPETYEEPAWVGVRWKVRTRTFAHVLTVDGGRPEAHAKVIGTDGPVISLTFRSEGEELAALLEVGPPFFYAGWGRDVIALLIDEDTDWDEVRELLTESYCLLAPKKLAAAVVRPAG